MDKKRILIRSKQFFEDHVDEIEEVHECFIENIENGIKVVYDKTVITIDDDIVVIERENSKIFIQNKNINRATYHTEYGTIEIEVEGKEINVLNKGRVELDIKYIIRIENLKEYLNEVQITEL